MKLTCLFALLAIATSWSLPASAQESNEPTQNQQPSSAVENQWFTGSLEAPSPALTVGGVLAIEPYVIYSHNTGSYGNDWTYQSTPNEVSQVESVIALKYSFTNRLTLQALPTFVSQWSDQIASSGIADLPIELEYRLKNENDLTGSPSVTFDIGMTFPTGIYDRLQSPLDALGSGAYMLKEGILLQSLFDTWHNHPMRLRLYGSAFEPLADIPVSDISVYGTENGFQGNAKPGLETELGLGVEYGLNQKLVLAFDAVENHSLNSEVNGTNRSGVPVSITGASSDSVALAPAVEYNWSDNLGVIAGVEFSVAGRNGSSYVSPQIAVVTAL